MSFLWYFYYFQTFQLYRRCLKTSDSTLLHKRKPFQAKKEGKLESWDDLLRGLGSHLRLIIPSPVHLGTQEQTDTHSFTTWDQACLWLLIPHYLFLSSQRSEGKSRSPNTKIKAAKNAHENLSDFSMDALGVVDASLVSHSMPSYHSNCL